MNLRGLGRQIVYLDFDGVLHDEEVYFDVRHGIYLRTPGRTLFEWEAILEKLLLPHPDVRIVLSTSWVPMRSFRYAKLRLSFALQSRVIGSTFHNRHMRREEFMSLPRGVQISQDAVRRNAKDWFAIDDDDERWPIQLRSRLILTDGRIGISGESTQLAISQRLAHTCFS